MNTRLKSKKALLLVLPFILLVGDSLAQRYAGPLSPEESLKNALTMHQEYSKPKNP